MTGQYESDAYEKTCKEKKRRKLETPFSVKKKISETIVLMIVKECIQRSNNSKAKVNQDNLEDRLYLKMSTVPFTG